MSRRATYVMSGLSGFYSSQGIENPPLVAPVIEAYCVIALSQRRPSTRGTYRSVLRQVSGAPRPRAATRFSGSRARPAYSASERAELFSMACAQRSAWRRRSALAVICLGMGAGLRAGEIVAARCGDVAAAPEGVVIHVRGELARVVPVGGEPAAVLRRLCRGDGTAHLSHPEEADRSYPNFVNDFCRNLVCDPGAPWLSVARLRSSFVCDHLQAGTGLSALLAMTGIVEVESLLYYSRHVTTAPQSKAALRAALAGI